MSRPNQSVIVVACLIVTLLSNVKVEVKEVTHPNGIEEKEVFVESSDPTKTPPPWPPGCPPRQNEKNRRRKKKNK